MSLVLPSCLSSSLTCNTQPVPKHQISISHLAPQGHIVRVWYGIQGDKWANRQTGVKHLKIFHFKMSLFAWATLARVQGWPFFFASSWKSLRRWMLFSNPIYIPCPPGSHVKRQAITSNTAHCFFLCHFSCPFPQNHPKLDFMVKIIASA